MLELITDPKIVLGWATLTLDERAVMLHRLYPVKKITGAYLGQIYKRNKINYKLI